MKPPLKKWGYPENTLAEDQWNLLRKKLFEQWKLDKTSSGPLVVLAPEISNKQKDIVRDIFAHITTKRILFQNDKRYLYTVGRNEQSWSHLSEEIKIADAVILPINTREIQDILQLAQAHDISIQVASQKNIFPHLSFPKNKLYCIISLELMQKIVRFDPDNHQISVQSGITVHLLQKYLSEHRWALPLSLSGRDHFTISELLQSESQIYPFVLNSTIHTPGGSISVSETEPLRTLFLNQNQTLGIHSEITFKIQPLPKYVRKVEARVQDLSTAAQIVRELKNSGITFNDIRIADLQSSLLLPISAPVNPSSETKDFFNSILKKSEELLFKDKAEPDRNIVVAFSFNEYQYSLSSVILKTKEIIQQHNGKTTTENIVQPLEDWSVHFPYFEGYSDESGIDTFHFSSMIPLEKIEEYDREIRKRLEKMTYYAGNRLDYLIQFSKFDFPVIQIDLYVLASKKHRKQPDSHQQLIHYFKEYLQPVLSGTSYSFFHDEIFQNLKNKIDNKGILSPRTDIKATNVNQK